MASEDWNIDLPGQRISHKTLTFSIQFDGDPTSNECEGKPSRFPDELTSLEKVRLLREAYDAYIEAFETTKPQKRGFGYNARPSTAKPVQSAPPAASSVSAVAASVAKKPTLSLKKS